MSKLPSRWVLAVALVATGLGLVAYSVIYSIVHIDDYLDIGPNLFAQIAAPLGVLLILLAPLVLRWLKLFLVLLVLFAAYLLWLRSR
jgi:hypothetical protein